MSWIRTPATAPEHTSPAWVTHPSLHVRDAHDAHVILEAVRLGILPLIRRRLLTSERERLRGGNVFVWEEADDSDDGGLIRWTDGRRWSQSRMRGEYLFYEEKVETTRQEKEEKAARRARRSSDPNAPIPPPIRRKDRPTKPNGLTKQTYSAIVQLPRESKPRRWHVVAYFTGNDYMQLPVIEDYENLRRIRVPEGIYSSNKLSMNGYGLDAAVSGTVPDNRQNGKLYDYPGTSRLSPVSSNSTVSSTSPVELSKPLPTLLPSPSSTAFRPVLPPLSSLSTQPPSLSRRPTAQSIIPQNGYSALTSEDRRVLNKFRVLL
ncbi:Gti1/Pac2 family-domain-containing protein [Mycena floridula]|nr:Gti1/Pac2 family-domain-containing protein [Mycena floridula]